MSNTIKEIEKINKTLKFLEDLEEESTTNLIGEYLGGTEIFKKSYIKSVLNQYSTSVFYICFLSSSVEYNLKDLKECDQILKTIDVNLDQVVDVFILNDITSSNYKIIFNHFFNDIETMLELNNFNLFFIFKTINRMIRNFEKKNTLERKLKAKYKNKF